MRGTTLGVYIGPFKDRYSFRATWQRQRTADVIGPLPPTNEAVELAFPERFVRDGSGSLIELDTRPVNLALAEKDSINWGFYLIPLTGSPSPKALTASNGSAFSNRLPSPNASPSGTSSSPRLVISLSDTWYLRDTLLVRQGLPELDLLNGAPTSVTGTTVAGTQPRHAVDFRTVFTYRGMGVLFSTAWHSATEVNGGATATSSNLYFSALTTSTLRLLANLEEVPLTMQHSWAKGLRVYLGATNLLDTHQKVRDATGATPVGFEPGYIDPLGRVVSLGVRKVF